MFGIDKQTQRQLRTLERQLAKAPRIKPCSSTAWVNEIPSTPGVYAIWEARSRKLVYVGETSSLKKRMRDLGRYPNHVARRKIASRCGLGAMDEEQISLRLSKNYRVSYLPVVFGRKEFEEYLTFRGRTTLLNSPSPRAHDVARFSWIARD